MLKNIYIIAGILLLGITYFLFVFQIGGENNKLIVNIFYLLAPVYTILAALFLVLTYGLNSKHGKACLLMLIGFLFWLIGESLWFIFDFILGIDPYPSIADFFYLSAYPLIALGILYEIKIADLRLSTINWKVFVSFGIFSTLFIIAVIYSELLLAYVPGGSIEDNLALLYGFASLILVIPAMFILPLSWEYKGGKIFIPWLIIFIGLSLSLLGDTLYGIFLNPYLEYIYPYNLIDLIWIADYIFVGIGFFGIAMVIRDIQKKLQAPK